MARQSFRPVLVQPLLHRHLRAEGAVDVSRDGARVDELHERAVRDGQIEAALASAQHLELEAEVARERRGLDRVSRARGLLLHDGVHRAQDFRARTGLGQ
eukprot:CAMPEP_0180024988 /NCGR_PEP_ID=MMETSP0984-20121128/24387_1 /TAXON_ID=483367 /ORGANISM="non described non described, Strain CCMP 2436" /LENGTH=99 /DNA_ID=CAMNT_0021949533 /DNA_START=284 /DNA_END=583 /DNA_ORIENTATION=+